MDLHRMVVLWLLMIPTAVASTAGYQIDVGDNLLIAVIGKTEYNQSVTVRADGKISYFGGDVPVVGKTPEEVRQEIRDLLARSGQLKDPLVMVSPIPREGEIFVGGAVQNPGRYPLLFRDEIGLHRAIALAGGTTELADLKGVQIVHGEEAVGEYDLSAGKSYQPIVVKEGDLVLIPALSQVDVRGQVQTEGKIPIRGRIRIDHALARAGGPLYDEADLAALVIVKSSGKTIELSLSEQFWQDLDAANDAYYLEDGDLLFVPAAYKIEKVYVLGYVRNPGPQKVRGPITPTQAIALAGGTDEEANIEKAVIERKDGGLQQINIKRYKAQMAKGDIFLYPGDTLRIPERFQVNWSLVLSFISVTSVVVSIFLR